MVAEGGYDPPTSGLWAQNLLKSIIMASNSSKTPPSLSKCKTYEDWLKLIKVWRRFTDLSKERQGSALVTYDKLVTS